MAKFNKETSDILNKFLFYYPLETCRLLGVFFADAVIQEVEPKVHRETHVFIHSAGDGIFHFFPSVLWSFSDSAALPGPISDFLITHCTMHIFQLLQGANYKT